VFVVEAHSNLFSTIQDCKADTNFSWAEMSSFFSVLTEAGHRTECVTCLLVNINYMSSTDVHRFSKNLGTKRVTSSKSYTEDPQALGTSMQILVALATWHLGFVHTYTSICRKQCEFLR
jgi:hypothetical protein